MFSLTQPKGSKDGVPRLRTKNKGSASDVRLPM
jgi:hypothetical protein